MKEAVRIGGKAWRGQRDKRAKRERLRLQRKLLEQPSINIRMRGGLGFDQIPSRLYGYRGCRPADLQADLHFERYRRSHIHVLHTGLKSRGRCTQVIIVVRNIAEFKVSLGVRRGSSTVSGHRILNFDGGTFNGCPRRVDERTSNRSRGTDRLSMAGRCATKCQHNTGKDGRSEFY